MDKKYYCISCKNFTLAPLKKGNGWIELILYLFYLIPGVIYSIWCRSGEPSVCPICQADGLILASMAKIEDDLLNREERSCSYCAEIVLIDAQICKHCKSNIGLTEDEKIKFRQTLTSSSDTNVQKNINYRNDILAENNNKKFIEEHSKLLIVFLLIGLILFINIIIN